MNTPLSSNEKTTTTQSIYRKLRHRQVRILWVLALIIVLYFIKYLLTQHPDAQPVPSVVVATAQTQDVPVYISALGNVTATYTVTIKTQINGLLMKVHFKEGQWVKKGELLAEIDQRPLLAQLSQYQGQLVRDKALLTNALIDLKRYQQLWKQDSISQQTLATQESLVKQYQGSIETDKGLIESTKVNLIYTQIISPIDGRVGLRLIDPGNFVQTSDTTGLVVVTTVDPITVIFSLPEDDIPALLPQVYAHKKINVLAYDRYQNKLLATGTLLAIDNEINTSTGTVNVKAQFNNKENTLFPSQFVNIKLLVDNLTNATVVSTAAIQYGSQGDFVYVINADSTVTVTPITKGVTNGDDTVIKKGLIPGQRVVVEGADKLTDGSSVSVVNHPSMLG